MGGEGEELTLSLDVSGSGVGTELAGELEDLVDDVVCKGHGPCCDADHGLIDISIMSVRSTGCAAIFKLICTYQVC